MPPTSSPVPSLSSVLSAVLTVHTIASGSPLRHHRTINQQPANTGKRLGLSVILPASSSSPSSSILQVVRYGKAKEQTEQEEREPGRRMPPPSSPVPRLSFCSVCCLYRPHHRQPLTTSPACVSAQGEGRAATSSASGRCHRHTSPPLRHRSTSSQQTAGQRLDGMTSCPPRPLPRPSLLSVALTVHAIARSSLPSSSAVPVILRPDLVRSFSSVRPSVFLFLVPRSPSCRLTDKPSPAAHYLTSSHPRQGVKGSPRPVLGDVIATHRHRSTSSKQTAGQRLDGLPS